MYANIIALLSVRLLGKSNSKGSGQDFRTRLAFRNINYCYFSVNPDFFFVSILNGKRSDEMNTEGEYKRSINGTKQKKKKTIENIL